MCSTARNHANPVIHANARRRRTNRRLSAVKLPGVRGHLLGVGPVPEDGVAVRHHFGAGLLAEYTHQQHQAHNDDHFHLQHHYSETSARIPLRCWVGQSVDSRAAAGTGDGSRSHVAVCCSLAQFGVERAHR
ncbi:unnamed protein product [Pleuronectes platessa]|uniref:Uncharacterized protein n=1 Tax=Pleuronectes platessa TaxID=8262 RepID=A0A9N7VU31_PLEPL|nr:unnamed protein product [Pleuronectes platessa]